MGRHSDSEKVKGKKNNYACFLTRPEMVSPRNQFYVSLDEPAAIQSIL
jgi:hypothetical protein